jgi:hypothetical protein
MKFTFLTENQIDILAEEAVTNYEVSASWNAAAYAALQYSRDEFGVNPYGTAIKLVINRAKLIWQGEALRVKAAIA